MPCDAPDSAKLFMAPPPEVSPGTPPAGEWIVFQRPNPVARVRLFCFPYAGGSASMFRSWAEEAPPEVEVCAIQPPGRENRWREPRLTVLPEFLLSLAQSILPHLKLPFAFFGHSLGALIAFELARLLRRQGDPQPLCLFVSGRRAPHLPDPRPSTHQLPDGEFIDSIRRLGGTPEELLQNSEVTQLFLPTLRADFALNETYTYRVDEPLECPIFAFGGAEDPEAGRDEVAAWDAHTSASFSTRMFPGDHFFVNSSRVLLSRLVFRHLLTCAEGPTSTPVR